MPSERLTSKRTVSSFELWLETKAAHLFLTVQMDEGPWLRFGN